MGHARDLAFWEEVHDPDLPTVSDCWHFPPSAFIRQFRKCGWFSRAEFKQFLPREVLRGHGNGYYYEPVPDGNANGVIITVHRVPLNIAMRKYLINTPNRVSAFFGNAMQETQWFIKLRENDDTRWYYPWDGRGFLQLTHSTNYIQYWDFRGRTSLISHQTRDRLRTAEDSANQDRPHAIQYLGDTVSGVTLGMLAWRENICAGGSPANALADEDRYSPSDSAGYYWAMTGMTRYADNQLMLERRVVTATKPPHNHQPDSTPAVRKVYYHSNNFRDASALVNYPAAVGNPNISFNGYVDRCVPFAQVLAVTGEALFPSGNGLIEFPEGRQPRRD